MSNRVSVVVNSTPLITLGNTGHIGLLREVFGEILIPEAVFREVTSKDDSASRYLLGKPEWIHVKSAPAVDEFSLLPARLHAGEVEVILLARSLGESLVVLDDGAARRTARYLGLRMTGTLGVLVAAKQRGLIELLAPCIDELCDSAGFRLGDAIVGRALKEAGEFRE